jgi:hypothetical protein
MGPWFLRDTAHPFRPGCSYETLRDLVKRGRIRPDTILRGPTTRQFWNFAARTPTVANLLGLCHNCHAGVMPDDYSCAACGAVFTPDTDRQHMGLAPVHLLPGQASPEIIALASVEPPAAGAPRRNSRAAPTPVVRAAIEPERAGGGLGRVALILAMILLLLAGAAAAILVPRLLNPAPAPTVSPAPSAPSPSQPRDVAVVPKPEVIAPAPAPTGESEPNKAAPTGPTGETGPIEPPPASASPTPTPAPAPAPSETPKPAPPPSDLVQRLQSGPLDEATVVALIDAARATAPGDAGAWEALIRQRAQQARLRGLP